MGHVTLDVHLRLLTLARRRQRDVFEHTRARALGDPPDRAALARGIQTLEHDAHLGAGRFDPLLHRHQLALQDFHLGLVLGALHLARRTLGRHVDRRRVSPSYASSASTSSTSWPWLPRLVRRQFTERASPTRPPIVTRMAWTAPGSITDDRTPRECGRRLARRCRQPLGGALEMASTRSPMVVSGMARAMSA